jgi:hypothetical protein
VLKKAHKSHKDSFPSIICNWKNISFGNLSLQQLVFSNSSECLSTVNNVKKLTKRDGSKSMRLEQFGFKKKCLINNDSNCNESSESERAPSSQNADISSCDKPQTSTSEPKDLSTVITDENIDKSPTSSESDLDADQESDCRKQSCVC